VRRSADHNFPVGGRVSRSMKLRSLLAALAGTALVVTFAPPAGAAPVSTRQAARVDSIAPGSYLTTIVRGPGTSDGGVHARSERLVVVDPATGATRTVYSKKVTKKSWGFTLADWSADGRTALLLVSGMEGSTAIVVDVTTGVAQELPAHRLTTAVLDPAGTGILAAAFTGGPRSSNQALERITWTGATTQLMGSTNGNLVAGRNGTVIAGDADRPHVQVLLSASTGAVLNQFRGGHGFCTPVRWWDQTQLLEMCGKNLYLVDPSTGQSDQLSSGHGRGDYGHLDARYVGSKLYVQVAGACGYTYVAKVTKHSTRHLQVPHAVGNVLMVDAVGKELILEHAASCDGSRPRSELTRFDPVHHQEKPILVLKKHEAFGRIMLLGEVYASTY
jgi:hypothetical protein